MAIALGACRIIDIKQGGVVLDPDGHIQIPSGPGIGVRVIADRILNSSS